MFDRIAARYDLLNRLLSLGRDGAWRRALVRALDLHAGDRMLDVAVGTADVALQVLRAHPQVVAVGIDPALAMLRLGAAKLGNRHPAGGWHLVGGDASGLPFNTGVFAGVTIAFGIRNVPDRLAALAEMARVTRPGGRVGVLELQVPDHGPLQPLARAWVRWVVPLAGRVLSSADEYRYLRRSMEAFPSPREFSSLMAQAGLTRVTARPLEAGAVRLYVGEVPR
jgi:demethylmenaquinone methyltransferase/2-methoxy-6-polyprenyl-1,4-benzoquinol methylase